MAHGVDQEAQLLREILAQLVINGNGGGSGTVTNVIGTINRVTVATGTTTPVIDISASYVGQSSIITLGTISTGVWTGTAIADTYISSASIWNAKGSVTSVTSANGNATITTTTTTPVITIVSSPKLQTTRAIYGNNFDGTSDLTQIIASTYGGTGNGFTKFSGPTTSEKTFTLPNVSDTIAALGTIQTFSALQSFSNTDGIKLTPANNLGTNRGFSLEARDATGLTYPTVFFRPTTTDSILAFDLFPNGSPTESAGNGFCWIDVCNGDFKTTPGGAYNAARIASTSAGAVFSSKLFNGATAMPMRLQVQTASGLVDAIFITATGKKACFGNSTTNYHLNVQEPLTLTSVNFQMCSATTGLLNSDGIILGFDGAATPEGYLQWRENSSFYFSTNATRRLTMLATGDIVSGVTASSVYRTTNGGSDVNAHYFIDPGNSLTTAGAFGFGFDTSAGFIYTHANGSRRIAGWSSKLTSLVNTAGSESSDLTWTPQNITDSFIVGANLKLSTAGNGLYVKEGSNATMGTATLSAGTIVVSTTKVTANSRIFLTVNGGTVTNVGAPYISARTAGTSFTISSTNVIDASNVAWIIIEPN